MIDALETVIAYLAAHADLNLLTDGRVAAKHKFGDGWNIPSKALQVRYDGGTPELDVQWQRPRLEARCYGESQAEASKVYRQLVAITRTLSRERVQTNEGFGLLHFLLPVSGPSMLMDPDTGVDLVLFFLEAAVSEEDIP